MKQHKTVRVDVEKLKEIEEMKRKSNGYVNLSTVIDNGIERELKELRKIYGEKK